MTSIASSPQLSKFTSAAPFWLSLLLLPLVAVSAINGGWLLVLVPMSTWYLFSVLDLIMGHNKENADPNTPDDQLFWYRAITILWAPAQVLMIFATLLYVSRTSHLSGFEEFVLFIGVGVITGTVGINYSHELMHQRSAIEKWMADILLASVLYSHFRSEHLLVHHKYVATPKDPVTARYSEGFWRFYLRVLWQCYVSAFQAEKDSLARKGHAWYHYRNPFWRYWAMQLAFLGLAFAIGGWWAVFLFVHQAGVAFFQLELVNYIEHYGLTREHLGNGRYERVQPHHSWNASHRASNWLLINLQRHSDHHFRPNRRFPLLQNFEDDEAPQLPYGYPVMTMAALSPTLWRKVMNPKVQAWRDKHYPQIEDWTPYKEATNPLPR